MQQTCALVREECNKCDLTIAVLDWPIIIMIGLGGFVLVVTSYHLFAVSTLWVGLQKSK